MLEFRLSLRPNPPLAAIVMLLSFFTTGLSHPNQEQIVALNFSAVSLQNSYLNSYANRFVLQTSALNMTLSATPDPIVTRPCASCGAGSTEREAVTDLSIRETSGVAGTVTAIGVSFRENGSNAVIASGEFDSNAVIVSAGSNRLLANGNLIARNIGVHFGQEHANKVGVLTYTVRITDENSNQVVRTLGVRVRVPPEWRTQVSGTSQVLLGVSFTDINRGYAVGTSGVIRITSNGGQTWQGQSSGTSRFLRDVSFSDATHGVIVGESGLILRTTDGTNWTQHASGTTEHLVHIHMLNNNVGLAVGQGGVILKTTDGGSSWTPQSSGTSVELPGVHMLDTNTAVAVGFGGTFLRTTDGGGIWTSITVPGFGSDLRSVHFFGDTGVAVSIGGSILRSTDGGQSWTSIPSVTSNSLFAVRFRDANTVYAVGTATILVSSNAGSTWTPATTSPFGGDLYGLSFASGKGWAVGQNGLILNDDNQPNTLQLDSASSVVGESNGNAQIVVTRTDTINPATVDYATSDTAALGECNAINGIGSSRCDYATSIGTLRFETGESSKTIFVPIVDDGYAEGNEVFTLTLSGPTGTTLGATTSATVTIQDNEASTSANPLTTTDFFIRQQYIDFLGREPDPGGLAGWRTVLNNCGTTVLEPCDRIEVSAGFFRSEEFQSRGYFIYRFFSVLGRIPVSEEFYPDFAKVSGFLTADQLEANKAAYVNEVMARADFQTRYGATLGNPTAYVEALLQTVALPAHPAKQSWINTLTANNTTQTRGQVLRQLVESAEVFNKYFNEAFVIMQYFGYLRRTADASYLNWIQTMNQTNGDYRTMINGFMNSAEYVRRFGP